MKNCTEKDLYYANKGIEVANTLWLDAFRLHLLSYLINCEEIKTIEQVKEVIERDIPDLCKRYRYIL